MVPRQAESWVTSAVSNESVPYALVLAESLRRTKTRRVLSIIISSRLSQGNRNALEIKFDHVICMDETSPSYGLCQDLDMEAKIYALSLRIFHKCVFVSPYSLILENMDNIFEIRGNITIISSDDLALFVFKPNLSFACELQQYVEDIGKIKSDATFCEWLEHYSSLKDSSLRMAVEGVVKYSTTEGILKIDHPQPKIIQFVNAGSSLLTLESSKFVMGKVEQTIITTWSNIYNSCTRDTILDPKSSLALSREYVPMEYVNEPIAIIGMSCRFPGANNVEEFWNMLYNAGEGIGTPPPFRWTGEHGPCATSKDRMTNAGFLSKTVDEFDAKFFGVSPKDAVYMDPQARLLHEVLWESLEDSGIDPLSLYGTHTGIFTGSWMNDYKDIVGGSVEKDFFRTYMGNSIGAAAARLSFLLGLSGPSIATESGCSSAIVALDLAVKSLRQGETHLALVGGVNLLLHPFTSDIMDFVVSPNGRCRTFDAKADGFARAEGCGVLVLKRLSDALRDRDNILGVVRGSAVTQEGISRSLGTPTVHTEALAMTLALENANVRPEQVSFLETHGTGTVVGDSTEFAAITKAYCSPKRMSPLVIGSVKTNVGHTESCSGITGIIKTVLAMKHQLIPKHRNLESVSSELTLDLIPAVIPLEAIPWPKVQGQPRIAGVSSFGITGTDGHVIIEEPPDCTLPKFNMGMERPISLLKISAKSEEALDELIGEYKATFLERADDQDANGFENAAYTANLGRASFNYRAFIIARNYRDAAAAINNGHAARSTVTDMGSQPICFLFPGQGSQYYGMAKSLYDTCPVFRMNFDICDKILTKQYQLSLKPILWENDSPKLKMTIYSQTSIFCVEYCLLKLWQSWGIHPDIVLGHSLGEFCAAVAAGILKFHDALKLVVERSRLIEDLPNGAMLVVKASKPEVEEHLALSKMGLEIAAENSTEQIVVAGDYDNIQRFWTHLKENGIRTTVLDSTHAFHSKHMDPILSKYRKIAESLEYNESSGTIRYISGMEGRTIPNSSLNADYWVRHVREPVNFLDACDALRETGCPTFLEVGPHPILSNFVMTNINDSQSTFLPSLRRGRADWETMLNSLGRLYLIGLKVDWKAYDEPYIRKKVSLPFHPFHRKSFWVEKSSAQASSSNLIHPLIGHPINSASALNIFQNEIRLNSLLYLKDHRLGERIVFPGAGFTEIFLAAGYCVANGSTETLEPFCRPIRLENLRIETPLEMKEVFCLETIVDLPGTEKGDSEMEGFRIKIYQKHGPSIKKGKWIFHASSSFLPVASTDAFVEAEIVKKIPDIVSKCEPKTLEVFYKFMDNVGLKFGDSFKMIRKYWSLKSVYSEIPADEVVTEIRLPLDQNKYILHPIIIDAAFQSIILATDWYTNAKCRVPISIRRLTVFPTFNHNNGKEDMSIYIRAWIANGKYYAAVTTPEFQLIAFLEDVEIIESNVRTIGSILEQQFSNCPDAWEESWRTISSPFSSRPELPDLASSYFGLELQEKLEPFQKNGLEDLKIYKEINRLLYLYIVDALSELGWKPEMRRLLYIKAVCTQLQISA